MLFRCKRPLANRQFNATIRAFRPLLINYFFQWWEIFAIQIRAPAFCKLDKTL